MSDSKGFTEALSAVAVAAFGDVGRERVERRIVRTVADGNDIADPAIQSTLIQMITRSILDELDPTLEELRELIEPLAPYRTPERQRAPPAATAPRLRDRPTRRREPPPTPTSAVTGERESGRALYADRSSAQSSAYKGEAE